MHLFQFAPKPFLEIQDDKIISYKSVEFHISYLDSY